MTAKQKEIEKLEKQQAEPNFWSNQDEARRVSAHFAELQKLVSDWQEIERSVSELETLINEIGIDSGLVNELEKTLVDLERKFQKNELRLHLAGEYDRGDALITLQAGAGGTDAQEWTQQLLRMYTRFGEQRAWRVTLIDESPGLEAGIKSATLALKGQFAYGYLKHEAGVHRLIRISPYSAQQLRHTSFALVDVVPIIEDPKIEIAPADLELATFRSGGPGGQNINRRETAVRITHIPTGIAVTSQVERSQASNREIALKLLKAKLTHLHERARQEKKDLLRQKVSPEWGNQIRTYVMHPYKQVRDHRTKYEKSDVERVLDGDLDDFIDSAMKHDSSPKLKVKS